MSLLIRHSGTKDERTVSEKEWETIQANKLVKGWYLVPKAAPPKELEEFEAKKKPATPTAKEETPKNTSK